MYLWTREKEKNAWILFVFIYIVNTVNPLHAANSAKEYQLSVNV